MKQFVERMIIEKEELDCRIKKAKSAVERPPCGMDAENRELLKEQIGCMEKYSKVLRKRIEINMGIRRYGL